jgi:hypothetical protein
MAGVWLKTCDVDGCDNKCHGRSIWCKLHYTRHKRHGDPNIVFKHSSGGSGSDSPHWVGNAISYDGIHFRIRTALGPASGYTCSNVACDKQATQWAYDHLDLNEKFEMRNGYLLPYSADIEHYRPLCIPCHNKLDHMDVKLTVGATSGLA